METQHFGFSFYSTCLSLCKLMLNFYPFRILVMQDFYDFGNNRDFSQKQNDCSAEYKAGRYHLRIERWKRLQCNNPFGRKELSNTFRYVFSHAVRVVNLLENEINQVFCFHKPMWQPETLRQKRRTRFWLSWFM